MKQLRSLPIAAALAAGALFTSSASAQVGTAYCMANPNSSGTISLISATGSTDVTQNDLTLNCDSLPNMVFGYFVTSQTQSFVANPACSAGNLCVGGMIGRYAGNILTSGTTGSVSLAIDLTSIPLPGSNYAAMPGDTVNFQFWHRDAAPAGGATSNFSQGLEVQFDSQSGPTFETDVYPLLTQNNVGAQACSFCHGNLTICSLDLSSAQAAYTNLINTAAQCCTGDTLVVPNDLANSLLYQKLNSPACGSQMPLGGSFAGDPDIIRDWILGGAPF